jgi:pyrimidine operon attenuation protein/uracil phosphoribosyltransferase
MERPPGRKIIDRDGIRVIVDRMCAQVYEQFCNYTELIIIGIEGEGFFLAQQMLKGIQTHSPLKCTLYKMHLDKHQHSLPQIHISPELPPEGGIPVLLVDDVLNSGRTLTYAISPLVTMQIPGLKMAVLVERMYRDFPVSASITGMVLSTTLEQHVLAVLNPEAEEQGVFLH